MSTFNQTHNHQVIRQWVEQRNGIPARTTGTGLVGDEGALAIHFPRFRKSDDLEEISWEDFFSDFEKDNLDFLSQDKKANGAMSTFYQLVARLGSGKRTSFADRVETDY